MIHSSADARPRPGVPATRAAVLGLLILGACTAPASLVTDYRAAGNEPFWSLEIAGRKMRLQRPGLPDRETPAPTPQATGDGLRYAAAGLTLTILPGPCQDNMSGAVFHDRVRLSIDGAPLEGCGGGQMPPQGLEGTRWIVTELAGERITAERPPSLEVDADGRVSGFDGCNRYAGGLRLGADGTVRHEGQGISTLMACLPERTPWNRRFQSLRGAATQWRFEGSELLLLTPAGESIRLRQSF